MATITPPAPLKLRGAKWRVRDPAQVNRSSWSGRRKVVGLPGAATWSVSGQFVPIIGEAAMLAWRAFFLDLRGVANRFPVRATESRQTTIDNPTVGSGATGGAGVPLTGLPPDTLILKRGQLLSVTLPSGHQRLAGARTDLVSNSSGQVIAPLSLELGEVPAPGAAVEIQWPFSLVAMRDAEQGWDVDPGLIYGFVLDAEEAR